MTGGATTAPPTADGATPAAGPEPGGLRPRPALLRGTTHRTDTPVGTAFVTLNETAEGEPFEVFVGVGKAGSDLAGLAEAIGRLCSLCLQLPGAMDPEDRLRAIAEQLGGIGGARSPGPDGARSLPDAIARVLAGAQPPGGPTAPAGDAPSGHLDERCARR